jgi:hypothetical protein
MGRTSVDLGEVCIELGDQGWFLRKKGGREALKLLIWWCGWNHLDQVTHARFGLSRASVSYLDRGWGV